MIKENIPEYSVTEISRSIKDILEDSFGYVRIKGEISGLTQASSGHVYLTLKDDNAIINGIIWKSTISRLTFKPLEGIEVVCRGKLTTGFSDRYPGRSNYSIHIDSLMPAGEGALMQLIAERKKKYESLGYFDASHKKCIPLYPKTIGIITSPTGAVIQDMIHRIEERFPCNVLLWPVPVQGDDASGLIANAIKGFNNLSNNIEKPDTIIVARGGGSIEDLWAFNEEDIVEAVYECDIPLISAVGHETDTTLIDFVSDLRAPTPTAAAELSTPLKNDLLIYISDSQKKLNQYMQSNFDNKENNFDLINQRLPTSLRLFINSLQARFTNTSSKLNINVLREQLRSRIKVMKNILIKMESTKNQYISKQSNKINILSKLIESLSYKSVINRGYSVIRNSNNKPIKSKIDILDDKKINIELSNEIFNAEIK